jgi:hypothetical protein
MSNPNHSIYFSYQTLITHQIYIFYKNLLLLNEDKIT